VRFYGAYTTHRVFGKQFKVAGMEMRMPEGDESIRLFLSGGLIKGVGEVLAARIVEEFHEQTFDVIEHDPLALSRIKGISPALAERPQIVIANKADALDREVVDVDGFEEFVRENGWELLYVSAATGEGLREMIELVWDRLKTLPPIKTYESEFVEAVEEEGKVTDIRREGGKFIVEGKWIYNLMNQINFDDYESLNYFQRALQKGGVFEALEDKGCRDGDTVSIYDFEFDYVK
jgi:GTP-binding protein